MALTTSTSSLKVVLNNATPGPFESALQVMKFGNVMRAMPTWLRRINPSTGVNPYALTTIQSIELPDDAKAAFLMQGFAYTGTGTAGVMINDAWGTTPTTTLHMAITPSGDLAFLSADAWTSVDVLYVPDKYDLVEITLPVVSNAMVLPVGLGGVTGLFECESLTGTLKAKLVILAPGGTATTGKCALTLDMTTVNFASANAVTSARVKFGVVAGTDVNALLEASMGSGAAANLAIL